MSAHRPESPPTTCFSLLAAAEPGTMQRVLQQFAKRNLVPTQWHSAVSGDELSIDIQMQGLERGLAEAMAANLRQIVSVSWVATSERAALKRA